MGAPGGVRRVLAWCGVSEPEWNEDFHVESAGAGRGGCPHGGGDGGRDGRLITFRCIAQVGNELGVIEVCVSLIEKAVTNMEN